MASWHVRSGTKNYFCVVSGGYVVTGAMNDFTQPPDESKSSTIEEFANNKDQQAFIGKMILGVVFACMLALVSAATDEQFAPEVLRMDVPPLQITSASHEVENGVDLLRVFGENFGSKLNVFFGVDVEHLTKCTDVVREAPTEIVCKSLPRGAGKMLVVVERLAETEEVVEARHRAWWSYLAPVVTSVTGGVDGLPLLIGGEHFGTSDAMHAVEVFIGAYAAHSRDAPCVVNERGNEIRCAALPAGFGSQLHVTVCVAGVCGTSARPLVDYDAPVIEFARVIDARLHLYGTGFGPAATAAKRSSTSAAPTIALEIDGQLCANAEVIVAGREVACDAHEAPDARRTLVTVHRHGERMAARLVKRAMATVSSFAPSHGPTTGDYEFTVHGSGFGVVGTPVTVTIGDRSAHGCVVTASGVVTCTQAPAGFGVGLAVTADGAAAEAAFNYDEPEITSVTRADTRGGKVFVHGRNFGPSFAPVRVQFMMHGETHECDVERSTHTRIQCHAPRGRGERHHARVVVGEQSSATVREFSYRRPEIHATTRPHWAGGYLYIRGMHFGHAADDDVEVHIGHEACRHVEISRAHEEIRCRARPGAADGREHTVRVRVAGQSSDQEGHSFHHMQYGNHAPQFAPHPTQYVAVAGERLRIRLPASDRDGDEIYFRARALPDGAVWRRGFDFVEIDYDVPAGLLAWPLTELNVTAEAIVTDGPGTSVALLVITARACASTLDTCKDMSCVARDAQCAQCPLSHVVQCSAARPILEPVSGACSSASELGLSWANVAAAPVASAGFTLDLNAAGAQRALLFSPMYAIAGAIDVVPPASAVTTSATPSSLVCVEVASCEATAAAGGSVQHSRAVQVALSNTTTGTTRIALALPLDISNDSSVASIGPNVDGYGSCLGRFDATRGAWQCVDESLIVRDGLLAGFIDGDGCYAIVADNCPDVANPDQTDSNNDGVGDVCAGGATLCEDCHSWNALNVKYLRKFAPTQSNNQQDTCASLQSPLVLVSNP